MGRVWGMDASMRVWELAPLALRRGFFVREIGPLLWLPCNQAGARISYGRRAKPNLAKPN